MIGRLVEEQDIGRGRQHARQRSAACLAAGKMRRVFPPGEAELIQEIPGKLEVIARSEAGFDIGKGRCEAGEIRLLWQIPDNHPRLRENRAAVRLDLSRRDLSRVDLPDPLRPTRATRSPEETDSSTPER